MLLAVGAVGAVGAAAVVVVVVVAVLSAPVRPQDYRVAKIKMKHKQKEQVSHGLQYNPDG